ncbi:MAG: NAD-dependent epimerase/dehydratase family protein [bacterium]|nr:MAG: NAD-dependent epimerase/dehydratase family protein [bacterium]
MKCLVTGHSGLIGSDLVDLLLSHGHDVYGISSSSRNENLKCKNYYIDLKDTYKSKEVIESIAPEIVYALAADASEIKSLFSPIKVTKDNIDVFLNTLVPSLNSSNLKRVIFASSAAVYGNIESPFKETDIPNPQDIYGISKLTNENFLKVMSQAHGFEFVIVRPHNVFGPRQRMNDPYRNVVTLFMNNILRNEQYTIYGKGEMKRCFSYSKDVADVIYQCGFKNVADMTFNVGSDTSYSLQELSDMVREISKTSLTPKYLPLRPKEIGSVILDHKLQNNNFDYKNTNIIEALKTTWEWAKTQGQQEYKYTKLEINNKLVPDNWK